MAAAPSATTTALESLASPASQGITIIPKNLVVDLSTLPNMPNKIEGVAWSPARRDVIVVANDNDFGMIDTPAFDARGRMTTDTLVKSKLIFVQLPAPVN